MDFQKVNGSVTSTYEVLIDVALQKSGQVNGHCERCGAIDEEVHHIIRLNQENILDASVSINSENLVMLCKDCRNKEHQRFNKDTRFDEEGNFVPR
ncbi:MAG: HNH endonuclease [Clostridia bacterium]|nr:HNH endonuclease [Clostridia bacterium]